MREGEEQGGREEEEQLTQGGTERKGERKEGGQRSMRWEEGVEKDTKINNAEN